MYDELLTPTTEMQKILNIVIAHGCYGPDNHTQFSESRWSNQVRNYMCGALYVALNRELITRDQCIFATNEIKEYLNDSNSFLYNALEICGLPNDHKSMLAIYKDWANRPSLVTVV